VRRLTTTSRHFATRPLPSSMVGTIKTSRRIIISAHKSHNSKTVVGDLKECSSTRNNIVLTPFGVVRKRRQKDLSTACYYLLLYLRVTRRTQRGDVAQFFNVNRRKCTTIFRRLYFILNTRTTTWCFVRCAVIFDRDVSTDKLFVDRRSIYIRCGVRYNFFCFFFPRFVLRTYFQCTGK